MSRFGEGREFSFSNLRISGDARTTVENMSVTKLHIRFQLELYHLVHLGIHQHHRIRNKDRYELWVGSKVFQGFQFL